MGNVLLALGLHHRHVSFSSPARRFPACDSEDLRAKALPELRIVLPAKNNGCFPSQLSCSLLPSAAWAPSSFHGRNVAHGGRLRTSVVRAHVEACALRTGVGAPVGTSRMHSAAGGAWELRLLRQLFSEERTGACCHRLASEALRLRCLRQRGATATAPKRLVEELLLATL